MRQNSGKMEKSKVNFHFLSNIILNNQILATLISCCLLMKDFSLGGSVSLRRGALDKMIHDSSLGTEMAIASSWSR